jgi:sarcosine oxidase subunit gamma
VTASTEAIERRSSPLELWSTRLAAASNDGFAIREMAFLTQVNLRGNATDPAFSGGVNAVLGYALPGCPNGWAGDADSQLIWLGPDEWLVVAGDGRNEALVAALQDKLRAVHHSATDISANRTVIEISGAYSRPVLAKGCTLDMHARAFHPRSAAQTQLAQTQAILQCMDEPAQFRLYVRNSFAQYLAAWLLDAAAECAASRELEGERISSRLS